jgi:hypothetical protein
MTHRGPAHDCGSHDERHPSRPLDPSVASSRSVSSPVNAMVTCGVPRRAGGSARRGAAPRRGSRRSSPRRRAGARPEPSTDRPPRGGPGWRPARGCGVGDRRRETSGDGTRRDEPVGVDLEQPIAPAARPGRLGLENRERSVDGAHKQPWVELDDREARIVAQALDHHVQERRLAEPPRAENTNDSSVRSIECPDLRCEQVCVA